MTIYTRKWALACLTVLPLAGCQNTIDVKTKQDANLIDSESIEQSFYELGKSYLAAQNYGLAIDAFRRDISKNGASVPTLNGLAIIYDKLGRYDLAQKYYERAFSMDPTSVVTLGNLAYSQYLQEEYDNASVLANKAHEFANKQADAALKEAAEAYQVMADEAEIRQVMKKQPPMELRETNESYSVQRVGEREWKMLRDTTPPEEKEHLPYKSSIKLNRILSVLEETETGIRPIVPAPMHTSSFGLEPADRLKYIPASDSEFEEDFLTQIVRAYNATSPKETAAEFEEDMATRLAPVPGDEPEEQVLAELTDSYNQSEEEIAARLVPVPDAAPEEDRIVELASVSDTESEEEIAARLVPVPDADPEEQMVVEISPVPDDESKRQVVAELAPVVDPKSTAESSMYSVKNGTGRSQMAKRMVNFLTAQEINVQKIANAKHFNYKSSIITYAPEYKKEAQQLSDALPFSVTMKEKADFKAKVELILGSDLLPFDTSLNDILEI